MPKRSDYGARAMHTTTITIPASLAADIHQRGMTFSGAIKQGVRAIDAQLKHNEQLCFVEDENRKLQRTIVRLEIEVDKYLNRLAEVTK